MTVLTVYADTSDNTLESDATSYSAARAGTGTAPYTVGAGYLAGAQSFVSVSDIRVLQGFMRFDTSALGSGASISSAVLNLECLFTGGGTTRTIQARNYDWGTSVTGADWVAGANLGSYPLVAHIGMSGKAANTRYDWTDDAMAANVNKTGYTPILIHEDLQASNVAPTDGYWSAWKDADTAGTTSDPKLTITYTAGPTGTFALTLPSLAAAFAGSVAGPAGGPWQSQKDGVSAVIDVSKIGTDGHAGLGASQSATYLVELLSDPIAYISGATLKTPRTFVVSGGSFSPSIKWDVLGVLVSAPAPGSDVATITLKAVGTPPAGCVVQILIAVGSGTPTPTVDHTADLSPSLTAPPTASTAYTYSSTYVAASGRDAIERTMVVQANILSSLGVLLDTMTASASWYSGYAS